MNNFFRNTLDKVTFLWYIITMKATMTIDMDNAAFQEAQDPQVELRRILLQVSDCLHGMGPIDYIPLIDINGNRVGKFEIMEKLK